MSEGVDVTVEEMTVYSAHHKANILYVSSRIAKNSNHHVMFYYEAKWHPGKKDVSSKILVRNYSLNEVIER